MNEPGPVRFSRYAYPPNLLGYCGPGDPAELLGMASEGRDVGGLRALAARFDGAWPYLQLIAACNQIDDPLDRRVVEAYWVGNALLDRVPPAVLVASVRDRFQRRAGRDFEVIALAAAGGTGARAHHSFHVFAVYPWLGLLRAGMEGAPLTVLDRCRIRWGTVTAVDGETLTVADRTLAFDGHRLVLDGLRRVEEVRRSLDGVGMLGDVAPGDVVSLHWDWACERLTRPALARLQAYTRRTLDAVNALANPGPVVSCDAHG